MQQRLGAESLSSRFNLLRAAHIGNGNLQIDYLETVNLSFLEMEAKKKGSTILLTDKCCFILLFFFIKSTMCACVCGSIILGISFSLECLYC